MSLQSNSDIREKSYKSYILDETSADEESVIVRANRFISLSKPRSIERAVECEQHLKEIPSFTEYNLENDGVYDIGTLEPLETKRYKNLDAYPYVFETDLDVLSWAAALMTESPLGFALLNQAQDSGWQLALSDLDSGGFHLDVSNKIIELDNFNMDVSALGRSAFYRNSLISILAKALRDVWHEDRWGAFEEHYKPEAVLLLERARAADTDSVSIFITWELRGAGYNEIWHHALSADDGDMARVLINILERYPTAVYNGMAMAHIFRQWYADIARVDALDHVSLQHMDDILQENDVRFGDKVALSKEFEMLSLLPDGVAYLQQLGDTVSIDPFFNGLNDPVNQTHLFQIVYDNKVTYTNGIPFRDAKLARKFLNKE